MTEFLDYVLQPGQGFLVGAPVQRPGQPIHPGRDGIEDIRESRADQMGGMRADIAALMIGMDNKVQPAKLGIQFIFDAH